MKRCAFLCYLRDTGGLCPIIIEKGTWDYKLRPQIFIYLQMFMEEDLLGARLCSRAEHFSILKADRGPALREPIFQNLPVGRHGNCRGRELGQFQHRF